MLGIYNENTNPVRYRDFAEFVTMSMLMDIAPEMRRQGKPVTQTAMRELRDNWNRNGEPMDFSTMKVRPSDLAQLLRSTGVTAFGKMGQAETLEKGVKARWDELKAEYDAEIQKGNFIHVVTDPDIRSAILDHSPGIINKATFVLKGKSARELSHGDKAVFRSYKDPSLVYNVTVNAPEAMQAAQNGFASAAVASPAVKEAAQIVAERDAAQSDEEEFEPQNEQLLGWKGGTIETEGGTRQYRGLVDVMGAYFAKADAELIAKSIDEKKMFDAEIAHNGAELLRYMRSSGYAFNATEMKDKGMPIRNKIEVDMKGGERLKVRIFDEDNNGAIVGRVYDQYNQYYYVPKTSQKDAKSVAFNSGDAIAILDYVNGKNTGTIKKSGSTDTSAVVLKGVEHKKALQVAPNKDVYRAFVFTGPDQATEFLEQAITDAQKVVESSFDVDGMQELIDKGLDDDSILVTSPEFQAELEAFYSPDAAIREEQERAVQNMMHSEDGGREALLAARDSIVGDLESGFNASFVIEHMAKTERGNDRDAVMSALKTIDYDMSKVTGNDFAVNAMKERLVKFNPETAKSIDELEHPMLIEALKTVQDTLKAGDFKGVDGERDPRVMIDDQGVIRWEANRKTAAKSDKNGKLWQPISGEIGQVMVPDENGIIKTQFQNDNNYGIVPGYTGYFAFDGDYDNRMERFRVKGFDQHLQEQLQAKVTHQMTRPIYPAIGNIPTTLDASGLNGLYHGDVYGKRIDLDFLETNQLDMDSKQAILKTLSARVRFDNQYSDYATTSAETQANRDKEGMGSEADKDIGAFSYYLSAGETNMRVLGKEVVGEDGKKHSDIENYADLTMTGTGKTQGLIWFLADGAEVNKDGSVTPSKGMLDKEGNLVPDTTALQKLPYFEKKDHNAWDRNQMASNQLMTALRVDENVNTALMSFGGWTFDDSYAVSKEFAERNQVFGMNPNEKSMDVLDHAIQGLHDGTIRDFDQAREYLKGTGMMWSEDVLGQGVEKLAAWSDAKGDARLQIGSEIESYLEEHGRFRPLQRGDKLSDFGGNKGTIGIVIDRDMSPAEAKAQQLDKEVAFLKANPKLDVISAPYSMMSRHNAGVVKELMDGEVNDLVNPETGEVYEAAMGQLNIIVTDMVVDEKTHAYSREDVLDGKGRKASGQLAWAIQSKGADGIMNEIYGSNEGAWSTYREYLITTGLDMKADGTIVTGYTPHADEERNHFEHEDGTTSSEFLDKIQDQGGFLDVPFEMKFKNDLTTTEIPIMSASLRQNVELVDGSMRVSNFTNQYANLYDAVGAYKSAETEDARGKAQAAAQASFDQIQSLVIDRQFNGGHNGKHSYIRDKIMGKRMQNSATGVAMVDPRLDIGQAGMNQDMMDALDAKEGDVVMAFRDPVWRDGAIRAMTVVKDDSVHGISINPIADKSHDMDFDGDTMGIIKFNTKEANADLVNKFSHWSNMIDHGNGKDELYFQTGMDLASAQAKADKAGDDKARNLYEKAHKNAKSDNPKLLKQSQRDLNDYSHELFRKHGFGGAYVNLSSDEKVYESFKQMVDTGAKGSAKKRSLENYIEYHEGKKTQDDARSIQYASGVKSDDTGLAGAFSQKLMAAMRNSMPTAALESMYPLTQGTLQIKHDAVHAVTVNRILTDDMNKTFNAKSLTGSKKPLTKAGFTAQLTNIMENDMKVDVNPKYIESVADAMSENGMAMPLKDVMAKKGSPMDRVAYGGGYEELKRLAKKEESLLDGKQNELFAPFSMRNATEKSKLAKKDTQRVVKPESTKAPVSEPKPEELVSASAEAEDVGMVL